MNSDSSKLVFRVYNTILSRPLLDPHLEQANLDIMDRNDMEISTFLIALSDTFLLGSLSKWTQESGPIWHFPRTHFWALHLGYQSNPNSTWPCPWLRSYKMSVFYHFSQLYRQPQRYVLPILIPMLSLSLWIYHPCQGGLAHGCTRNAPEMTFQRLIISCYSRPEPQRFLIQIHKDFK